jgi:hypothetical protein
VKGPD